MSPINQSPTSDSVVAETLNRAQKVAIECGKESVAVTYDLAIAKKAMQIQSTENPIYDNVFINLGRFHIEMSFFKVLGKYIEESGGSYILQESGILCKGSMNGFISGKSYNRGKRVHQILSVCMQILHFKEFLAQQSDEFLYLTLQHEIAKFNAVSNASIREISKELTKILESYERFQLDSSDGNHGKTAQYWIGYVDLVDLYHQFSRSIRSGDFVLYICCLPKLAAFNHVNYARWLVKYHDNLLRLGVTHPQVQDEFRRGFFSVKRTNKHFSAGPIDLALEQTTINANAASQHTGITSITNSISACQRWSESH